MKMYKYIIYLFFIFLFSSCASLKSSKIIENKIELNNENLNLLNGTYKINKELRIYSGIYSLGTYTNPILLFDRKEIVSNVVLDSKKIIKPCAEPDTSIQDNGPEGVYNTYALNLTVLNKNKIHAKLIMNDCIIKSYNIRGRIKDGYFEQNFKWYIIPAFLVIAFESYKFRIGLLNNGNIITDSNTLNYGTVYIYVPVKNNSSYINLEHQRQ